MGAVGLSPKTLFAVFIRLWNDAGGTVAAASGKKMVKALLAVWDLVGGAQGVDARSRFLTGRGRGVEQGGECVRLNPLRRQQPASEETNLWWGRHAQGSHKGCVLQVQEPGVGAPSHTCKLGAPGLQELGVLQGIRRSVVMEDGRGVVAINR